MLNPLAIAIMFFSLPSAGMAQGIFVPPATAADPGYLLPDDKYQRERSGTTAPAQNGSVEIELDAAAQARVRIALNALAPEYNMRFQRDGETRANEWIGRRAFELGQQEADIMKQQLGLD